MSLEQIKRDLEKDIVKNKSKLETWKRVTYLTKKDGSPYKIMAKNFENAKYGTRFNTFYLEISCECNNETGTSTPLVDKNGVVIGFVD